MHIRKVAQIAEKRLSQPIAIENRPSRARRVYVHMLGLTDGHHGPFVRAWAPWLELRDFPAASRKQPDGIGSGLDSAGHVTLAEFQQKTGAKLAKVPYTGSRSSEATGRLTVPSGDAGAGGLRTHARATPSSQMRNCCTET